MSFKRLFGIGGSNKKTVIKQINVTQAHELTSNGAVTLIDVRKSEEWNDTGRPQGSHGVTLQDPDFEAKVLAVMGGDKSKSVAFSCRTGGRSSEAANKAKAAGHLDISNVEGGFLAWEKADFPMDKGPF